MSSATSQWDGACTSLGVRKPPTTTCFRQFHISAATSERTLLQGDSQLQQCDRCGMKGNVLNPNQLTNALRNSFVCTSQYKTSFHHCRARTPPKPLYRGSSFRATSTRTMVGKSIQTPTTPTRGVPSYQQRITGYLS